MVTVLASFGEERASPLDASNRLPNRGLGGSRRCRSMGGDDLLSATAELSAPRRGSISGYGYAAAGSQRRAAARGLDLGRRTSGDSGARVGSQGRPIQRNGHRAPLPRVSGGAV